MALKRTPKNGYTAKVASVSDFEDTQSISVLAVVKTANGKACKDLTVSFNLSEDHKLAQGLYDGTVSEVGFMANGFSPEPIRGTDEKPIHAVIGMDKKSLDQLLSQDIGQAQAVTDEDELKRKVGITTRALDWFRSKVEAALEA